MRRSTILSTGSYLPEKTIPNEALTQFSPEAVALIAEKTGVLSRHHGAETQCTSDLAIEAARCCLRKIKFPVESLQGIIVSTSSPDRIQPATAARVQHELGAIRAFAFDINSVCSGSTFGIALADAFISSGQYDNILLIAAEMYSRILNPIDFSTYPYFGDGSGAILFQADESTDRGVLHSCLRTDGSRHNTISIPAGGTMLPYGKMTNPRLGYFRMKGVDVFSFTIEKGPEIIDQLLSEADVPREEIRCFLCHQANINVIRRIAEIMNLPPERFFVNIEHYGNTASASVLIALDEAITTGILSRNDLVVTVAFGGGLSWGANLIRI
jgi:3-oxoacyl-[acyl-carrier-protein] synthase-3